MKKRKTKKLKLGVETLAILDGVAAGDSPDPSPLPAGTTPIQLCCGCFTIQNVCTPRI
jgi:hypothetical protein